MEAMKMTALEREAQQCERIHLRPLEPTNSQKETTMTRKLYAYTVTAKARFTRFPMDQCRYDRAWPARSEDASAIEQPVEYRETAPSIRLASIRMPMEARWESFGWVVSDLKEERL
jgi:hypothetical protein